ncbi:MAG: TolC family protein [bacterium]
MKKLFIVLCGFILLKISSVFAQDDGQALVSLSISEAVELSIAHSEDIQISQENIKKMDNTYTQVRASILPNITGKVDWDHYIKSPVLSIDLGEGNMDIPLKQDWDVRAGATVSQLVWAFGKVNTAINIAREAIGIEKLAYQVTKNELIFAVKRAYYTILFAEETVKIADESHKNAQTNKSALKTRFGKGRSSRIDNIKMSADVASRMPTVLQAEKNLDQITISFKNMVGMGKDAGITFTDDLIREFPEYNFDDIQKIMLHKEPMLNVFRKNVGLQDQVIRLKKADIYPTLSGFATYNYAGNGDNIYPQDEIQPEVIAGLRLNLTFWDSGAMLGSYRQAQNDRAIAGLAYKKKIEELEVELQSIRSEYVSLIESYKANQTALNLAEESYRIALSSYKSGAVSQTMLNDAELQLTVAKLRTLTNLYNINMLIITIEKLIVKDDL